MQLLLQELTRKQVDIYFSSLDVKSKTENPNYPSWTSFQNTFVTLSTGSWAKHGAERTVKMPLKKANYIYRNHALKERSRKMTSYPSPRSQTGWMQTNGMHFTRLDFSNT